MQVSAQKLLVTKKDIPVVQCEHCSDSFSHSLCKSNYSLALSLFSDCLCLVNMSTKVFSFDQQSGINVYTQLQSVFWILYIINTVPFFLYVTSDYSAEFKRDSVSFGIV